MICRLSAREHTDMTHKRSSAQTFALVVGIVFILVGILGFIPGVVTEHDTKFIGQDGDSKLLGLFQINFLHNIVHLLFGVGVLAARSVSASRLYLIGGGAAYLVVWIFGILVDKQSDANFINLNSTDNALHLFLGLGMLGLGLIAGKDEAAGRRGTGAVAR